MNAKRKNTREHAKENLEILLYAYLPEARTKKWPRKKGESSRTWKPRENTQGQYNSVAKKEVSPVNSDSNTTRILGGLFLTPFQKEQECQDMSVSSMRQNVFRSDVSREVNQLAKASSIQQGGSQYRCILFIGCNLIDLDISIKYELIVVDPN